MQAPGLLTRQDCAAAHVLGYFVEATCRRQPVIPYGDRGASTRASYKAAPDRAKENGRPACEQDDRYR